MMPFIIAASSRFSPAVSFPFMLQAISSNAT